MLVSNLRDKRRSAVARVGIIFLVAVIIAIAAAAYYIFYFPTSTSNPDIITLNSFSLNAQTTSLTGTVKFESHTQISTLALYINGTYIGSENYSMIKSMLTPLAGGNYHYEYSLTYSASSSTFPMMSSISLAQNKAYLIMLKATFTGGSQCNGTTTVRTQ